MSINGSQVLTDFDIYATAGGKDKAVVEAFTATADVNGQISVTFNYGSSGIPQVNGIEVLSGGAPVQQINCGLMAGGTITSIPTPSPTKGRSRPAAAARSRYPIGVHQWNGPAGHQSNWNDNNHGKSAWQCQNPVLYTPEGTLIFNGSGTPQLLEVMGRDLGLSSSGFTNNFAFGTLALANNAYVQLVDQSQNTTSVPRALYVDSLDRARGDDFGP